MSKCVFNVGSKAVFLGNIKGTILEIDETHSEDPILWVSDSGIKMRFTIDGKLPNWCINTRGFDELYYSQKDRQEFLKPCDNR